MFRDTIIRKFNIDGHVFEMNHYFETALCYDLVKAESEKYWKTKSKRDAEENYIFEDGHQWSLGEMLKNNLFEFGYTVLFMDNKFIASGGIRRYNSDTTISLSRFFCNPSPLPYGNAFILPLHLEISKSYAKSTIITFNEYNKHLLHYYMEILPLKKDPVSLGVFELIRKFSYLGVQEINHVKQHVLNCNFN